MEKWYVAAKRADFDGIAAQFHISPVLARILRNRDVVDPEAIEKYLNGTVADLYAPSLLKGMEEAARILREKIRAGCRIRVIGDYDVDGICASYILKKGLCCCGAKADVRIPHRMKDGYGLNDSLVEEAKTDGIDTIVTCDNGIAAADQVRLAHTLGMTVIVTDHHEVPYEETESGRRCLLPLADAVIDPKQPGCSYPFREICGATVALKLVQELFSLFGLPGICLSSDPAVPHGVLDELLELAAFATVCDVMPLQDENRILVRHGLALMQQTQNPGLRALMEVNGILPDQRQKAIGAYHIGFVLGPCLNASGRLDTALRALALLESKNRQEAIPAAAFLKQLNDSRKEMTENFVEGAAQLIEESTLRQDRVLVVFLPDCHESIAGIIAGRLRERYFRPVFVLTRGEEGIKGSARSIEGYHIYEEMTKCRRYFTRYGGHRMAAGLSMAEADIDAFRKEINQNCTLTPEDMQERVHIDVPMPVSYVTFSLVEELGRLEPFGTGNPRPIFVHRDLLFVSARILGKNRNVLRFVVVDEKGRRWEMVYFGDRAAFEDYLVSRFGEMTLQALYRESGTGVRLSAVYYPEINVYQGSARLQLVLQYYR